MGTIGDRLTNAYDPDDLETKVMKNSNRNRSRDNEKRKKPTKAAREKMAQKSKRGKQS